MSSRADGDITLGLGREESLLRCNVRQMDLTVGGIRTNRVPTKIVRYPGRTRRLWPALTFLLLSCAAGSSWADQPGFECDSEEKTFTYTSSDDSPGVDPIGECRWDDGTDIIVHFVSRGDAALGGYSTISVWVNEAKWVDAAETDLSSPAPQTYRQTTRIKIDQKAMTVCEVTANDDNHLDPDAPHSPEDCKTQPTSSLPHDRDSKEFPSEGQERPLPPSISVTHSDDDKLCNALLAEFSTTDSGMTATQSDKGKAHKSELSVTDITADQLGKTMDLHPVRWDIENSGHPLWVTSLSGMMLSHLVYLYYVFDDEGLKHFQASGRSPEDLVRYARRTFPTSLGYCPSPVLPDVKTSQPCYTGIQDVWDMSLGAVTFRGVHYLLLQKDFIAVVKPKAGGKYEEPCQFKMAEVEP